MFRRHLPIVLVLVVAVAPTVSAAAPPVPGAAARKPATKKSATAPTVLYKYMKASADDDSAAIRYARDNAGAVQKTLAIKLTEIQTDHFLIFTDTGRRIPRCT
jgi:hypothetical protein